MRIFSASPAGTRILEALGLSDALVAVAAGCRGEAERTVWDGTPESLQALAPELVLVDGAHEARQLSPSEPYRGAELTGWELPLSAKTGGEVLRDIRLVGLHTREPTRAETLNASLEGRWELLELARPRGVPAIAVVLDGRLAGRWVAEQVEVAGGRSVGPAKGADDLPLEAEGAAGRLAQAQIVVVSSTDGLAHAEPPELSETASVWLVEDYFSRGDPGIVRGAEVLRSIVRAVSGGRGPHADEARRLR